MFVEQEGKIIGTLIVGAMSIDGTLNKQEREHAAQVLSEIGREEIIPHVGVALDEDFGDFDLFREAKHLLSTIGEHNKEKLLEVFSTIAHVVASDRFLSAGEASFLSALARRLKIPTHHSQKVLQQILEKNRGKIEISGEQVDAMLHPHLKELLSFSGSEDRVGIVDENSIEDRFINSDKDASYTADDIQDALRALGLESNGTIEDAEEAWKMHLQASNLARLADQGASFVQAAIYKAQKITNAFMFLSKVHASLGTIDREVSDENDEEESQAA